MKTTIRILMTGTLALALGLATPFAQAALINLSDLWSDPSDPGWGVNIVQQGDIAVVTVMVYAANGAATWYIASPAETYAWSGDGIPHLRGTLYRTRGNVRGSQPDQALAQAEAVGELYVSPIDRSRAHLDYTVDGVALSRVIERVTWSLPTTAATWLNVLSVRVFRDDDRSVTQQTTNGVATLEFDERNATLSVTDSQARCDYRGEYRQSGRLGSFAGNFSCNDLRQGEFQIDDVELTTHGIAGRIRAVWSGASASGTFGGPRR